MAVDDSYTKLLIHCDGADASTTFTDESGKTITTVGNAQVDTAYKVFGTGSLLLDGTGDALTLDDSEDWNFGSGDFTVDFRVKKNRNSTRESLCGQCNSASAQSSVGILIETSDINEIEVQLGVSGSNKTIASSSTITDTNFHHIAVVRYGNTMTLYIDGTGVGNVSVAGVTMQNSYNKFAIGQWGEYTARNFKGWIDEFRISKGIARWTSNFTPPTKAYGAVIYTLACAYVSFALTGYSILLKRIIKGLLSCGSFALTGKSLLFKKIKTLTASFGSFTLTGFNLLVHRLINIVMSVGSFALTGIDVIIIKGRAIFMSAGNFVVTGSELNFHRLIHLVASLGTYTITGINALLHRVTIGLFSFGSFVVTGQDSLFHRVSRLSMAFGSFVYTGISSVFHKRINILLSAGSYTLSGFSLLFHRGYTVILSAGNFVLTGFKAFFSGIGSWLWGIQDKDDGSGWTKQDKN